ncbi:MAG: hypothetical protein ACRDAV_00085, partial [Plesiomonas shigelloides]
SALTTAFVGGIRYNTSFAITLRNGARSSAIAKPVIRVSWSFITLLCRAVNRALADEHVDSMALFFALNGGILPRKRKKTAYFTQLSEITAILYR